MNKNKHHHGHDGRYPTKPPPWKYKITRQTTLNDNSNTSNHQRIFLHEKCGNETISGYNGTTTLPPTRHNHHPMTHNASTTFTNYPLISTITPFTSIPPTTTLISDFTSLHSTIRTTTPDASHDHHQYRPELPAQLTFTRHPSDSEQCDIQLPTDYSYTDRHPSDCVLKNTRQTPAYHTTITNTHTTTTNHTGFVNAHHTNTIFRFPPFHLPSDIFEKPSHEFLCTIDNTEYSVPPQINCPTLQLVPKTRTQHTRISFYLRNPISVSRNHWLLTIMVTECYATP
jgi:hypothetical protein